MMTYLISVFIESEQPVDCQTCGVSHPADRSTTQERLTPRAIVKAHDTGRSFATLVKCRAFEENPRADRKGPVARQPPLVRTPHRFASSNRIMRFRRRRARYSFRLVF